MNEVSVEINNCAPIIVTTLNRHSHFIRMMESLRFNTWAKFTDVYIGLDFPPSEEYKEGYNIINNYLDQSFPEFKSVTIFRRDYNYGCSRNMRELRNLVLTKYDKFIRTDDDAEFSPNFLEYMNKCLMEYENDDRVIAVTGYTYPIRWKHNERSTCFLQNFSCPMWGTGFWKRSFLEIENFIDNKELLLRRNEVIRGGKIKKMLSVASFEYMNLCMPKTYEGSLASMISDVSVRMYMAIENKYVVSPIQSKVRNHGFDGSGVYCPQIIKKRRKVTSLNYNYELQPLDVSLCFSVVADDMGYLPLNRGLLNNFDALPLKYKLRTWMKIFLFRFLGESRYMKFISNE